MTFSQSLNILSSNCVISVDRNCVLLLLLFFLPTLIDKDKILLCCVMSCQTSPSSTRTTLQQKKPLPKSIITINMCALQNHTVRHERHRSSINNVSSLHLVLMLQSWNLVLSYNTVWLYVLSHFFIEATRQSVLQHPDPGPLHMFSEFEYMNLSFVLQYHCLGSFSHFFGFHHSLQCPADARSLSTSHWELDREWKRKWKSRP